MSKIIVKYSGKKVPSMAGKIILPGVNEVEEKTFNDHINSSIGKTELKRGDWEIVKKSESKDEKEPTFFELTVPKQKEIIFDCMDLEYLTGLADNKQIAKSTKKEIERRIVELEKEFSSDDSEKDDTE